MPTRSHRQPPPASARPPSRHRLPRLALLVSVPGSAYVMDRLLGSPLGPWRGAGLTGGDLAARLTPGGLHHVLVLCSWLAWLASSLTLLPLVVARRDPRPVLVRSGAVRFPGSPGAVRNRFQAAAGALQPVPRRSTATCPETGLSDDTMSVLLAWGERFDDPDPWRELGPAEAGMTALHTEGGAAAAGGGDERRWWRGRDDGGPRARRSRQPAFGRRGPQAADRGRREGPPAAEVPPPVDAAVDGGGGGGDRAEGAEGAGAAPAVLVGIGHETLDLMALGSVALAGDDDDVAELLCSMVVDVVSGRERPAAALLVGFGQEMHALDGVWVVDDEAAALACLEGRTSLVGLGSVAVFVDGPQDACGLEALISATVEAPVGEEAGPLAGLRVAVVVAGGSPAARWQLRAGRGALSDALTEQVAGQPQPATVTPLGPRRAASAVDEERAPAGGPAGAELFHQVEVGVLGQVRVAGTPTPFDGRPRLTELVVYLALHPEGATTDAWATALWPDRRMPASTLANRLSEARAALGTARDGFAHLRKSGGRHLLGPEVTTDWDCFQALAAENDPRAWREALALVRGRPFEGLREPQWALLEGFVPSIESAVVELACRLAEHLLAMADPEGAEWAARRAMLACPWDERLYRLVMRAADSAGNRPGVETALRQLAKVLEAGGDPLSAVHPETAALYRSLMTRREAL